MPLSLLILFTSEARTQHTDTDSILKQFLLEIDTTNNIDSKVVDFFNVWMKENNTGRIKSNPLIQKYLDLASVYHYPSIKAKLLSMYGLNLQLQGKYDSAKLFIDSAINVSVQYNLEDDLLIAKYRLGSFLYRTGQSDSAEMLFNMVLSNSESIGFERGQMLAFGGLGKVNKRAGNYDKALDFFMKEQNLAKHLGIDNTATHAMLNIGIIYGKMKDFPNATFFTREALKLALQTDDTDRVSQLYNNLAILFRLSGEYDSSVYYQQKSLDLAYKRHSNVSITRNYMNLGTTYAYQKLYDKAKVYYDTAYLMAKKYGNKPLLMSVLQNLSAVSKDRGDYQKSIDYGNKALDLAKSTGQIHNYPDLYKNLYFAWKKSGNPEKALYYHELYAKYNDSIFNETRQNNINELEIKYNSEKLKSDNLILENKNLANNIALARKQLYINILLGTSFTVIVVIILLWIIYRVKNRKNTIIRQQEIDQLKREKEILSVKSLITGQEDERRRLSSELHDGLGILLSTISLKFAKIRQVSHITDENLAEKTFELINEAGKEVRRISHNMMPGLLSNFGVIEAIKDIFDNIEDSGIVINLKLPDDQRRFDENTEVMIYRIVQELVNNTIKHAEASQINLKVSYSPAMITIEYSDKGKGYDINDQIFNSGLGLAGILSRVSYLNGAIYNKTVKGKGSDYLIKIPLNTNNKV